MNPGLSLKQLRRKNGYTLIEAAKEIGISHNSLSKYEKNEAPIPVSVIVKLARLYDFDVFDVFGVHEPNLECDISIYYYFKSHFAYVIRHEKAIDIEFGNIFPDAYYSGRFKDSITEYINNQTIRNNYPGIELELQKDTEFNAA